jgi:hypothetical protein
MRLNRELLPGRAAAVDDANRGKAASPGAGRWLLIRAGRSASSNAKGLRRRLGALSGARRHLTGPCVGLAGA